MALAFTFAIHPAQAEEVVQAETSPSLENTPEGDTIRMDPVLIQGTEQVEADIPKGASVATVNADNIKFTRSFTVKELVEETPGVFLKQGNGPRDVGISIRGSGAKVGFGVRNIKVYEDGFPVTQSDGLSRTDITDPHAYEGIDVVRGPSSALYGNYANGGAVNFRTRKGRDIMGFEFGNDYGSFDYHNHYFTLGDQSGAFEYSAFASYIQGNTYIDHTQFESITQNLKFIAEGEGGRKFTFKLANNFNDNDVPSRLTYSQFNLNPRDAGTTAGTVAGTVSAEQAAQHREDRRMIMGGRYEQDIQPGTHLSLTGVYDVKDINQTFSNIGDNINPNYTGWVELTHEGQLFGLSAKHSAGAYLDYMEQEANSFRNLGDFQGTRGSLNSNTRGFHRNIGGRLKEEIEFNSKLSGVFAVGLEYSQVDAQLTTYSTTATVTSRVDVEREFHNLAPEVALTYSLRHDRQLHARVSTAYGIPGIGSLTTAPTGVAGNNTGLDPQRNIGFDIGFDGAVCEGLVLSITGYYEFFFDEFVTQSPGAGLSSFTSNASEAEHRGIEIGFNWRPFREQKILDGVYVSGSYTFNDHEYTDFAESIASTNAGQVVVFDRSGNQIPGVERQIANVKLGYDKPVGFGAWIEMNWLDDFFVNNSNTLKSDAYSIFNINLHYRLKTKNSFIDVAEFFFEIDNVFDDHYIESVNVVSDLITDTPASRLTSKQAFFAGAERSYYGGVKLKF